MNERAMLSDSELICRIREGDEGAFSIVFEMYSGKLYSFCFGFLKNREQSQEVIQEVFLNLWLSRDRLDEQYPLAPYLYTITKRRTLNVLRNIATSQNAIDKLWLSMKVITNETEDEILGDDLKRLTESAVAKLPKQQQLVFRMSRQEELSYDEIAEELHISRNTVKNHLSAALKSLRAQFKKSILFSIF